MIYMINIFNIKKNSCLYTFNSKFIFKDLFILVLSVYMCACMSLCVPCTCRYPAESKTVVSHLIKVLETKSGSSTRVISTLNH